jgi:hypothetical protein
VEGLKYGDVHVKTITPALIVCQQFPPDSVETLLLRPEEKRLQKESGCMNLNKNILS